jgi:alkyl hydroperoxide reductase subunit AhpF
MDPVAIASALIAARMGQAQMAAAARMMKNAQAADTASIMKLLAAADQNGEALAAAVQQGMGEYVDIMA